MRESRKSAIMPAAQSMHIQRKRGKMEELLNGFPFVVEIPVAWGDMDAMRHVNNTVYFRYFETARIAFIEQAGLREIGSKTGVHVILGAINCRFRKPLTYPDTVSVGVRVSEIGQDRYKVQHRLVSHKLKAVAAEGEGTLVAFDYRENRKAPALPDELRRHLEEFR
jgi:acyl-CoA thioester hydrolase